MHGLWLTMLSNRDSDKQRTMLCWPCCHYRRKQEKKRWSLLELFFYVSWGPQMLWLNFFIFLHVNKTAEKLHVAVLLVLFRYTRTPTAVVVRILLVINVRVPIGGGKGQPFYMTFFIFFTYWRDGDGKRWLNILLFWSLWEGDDHYWGVFPLIHVAHESDSTRYHFLFYLISYKKTTSNHKVKKRFRVFILLYWMHCYRPSDNSTRWRVVFLGFFIVNRVPVSTFVMLSPLFIVFTEVRNAGERETWVSFCLLFHVVKSARYFFLTLFPLIFFFTKRNRDLEVVERISLVLPIFFYSWNAAKQIFYSFLFCRRRTTLADETNLTAIFPLMYHKYADGQCDYLLSLLWYKNVDYVNRRASYNTLPLPFYRKVIACSDSVDEYDEDDFIHRFEMFFPFFFRKTHRTKGIDDMVLFPLYWKRETFEGRVRRKMLLFNLYGTIHSVENPDRPGECTSGFDILWPLVHYEKNAPGTFTYIRVLPFFYSKHQEGHRKLTVLFPFYFKVLFDPSRQRDDSTAFRQTLTVVLPFGYRETNQRRLETKTKAGLLCSFSCSLLLLLTSQLTTVADILPPYYRDHSYTSVKTKKSRSLWPIFGKKYAVHQYSEKSKLSIAWPIFRSYTRLNNFSRERKHQKIVRHHAMTFSWKHVFSWDNPNYDATMDISRSGTCSSLTHSRGAEWIGEELDIPMDVQIEAPGDSSEPLGADCDAQGSRLSPPRLVENDLGMEDADQGSTLRVPRLDSPRLDSPDREDHSVASDVDVGVEEECFSGDTDKASQQKVMTGAQRGPACSFPEASLAESEDETESDSDSEESDTTDDDYDISLSSESSDGGYGGGLLGGADLIGTSLDTERHHELEPDQEHEEPACQGERRVLAELKHLQMFPFFIYNRSWGESSSKLHWRIPGVCSFTKAKRPAPVGSMHVADRKRTVWDLALLYLFSVKLALCRFCTSAGDGHSFVLRYIMPLFYFNRTDAREEVALFWLFHPVISLLCMGRLVGAKDATYRFGPFLVAKTDREGRLKTILCLTLCGLAVIRYHRKKHFHVFPLFYSHCSGTGEAAAWHWALLGYMRVAMFFHSPHRTYLLFLFYSERHVHVEEGVADTRRYSLLWLFHYRAALFHYDSDWRWFILFVVYKDLPKAGRRSAYLWLLHPVISIVYHDPGKRTSVFPLFWRSFYKKEAGHDNGSKVEERWALGWLFHPVVSLVFYDTAKVFRVFLLCWISNDEASTDQLALGWLLHPRFALARYHPEGTSHVLLLGWRRASTEEWGVLWLLHYSMAAAAKRNLETNRRSDEPAVLIYFLMFLFYLRIRGVTHWFVCLLFYKKYAPDEDLSVFRFLYRLLLFKSRNGTVTHLEVNPFLFYRNTARRQMTLLLSGMLGSRQKYITLLWCIKVAK